jgi:deoxyguanosine kinase
MKYEYIAIEGNIGAGKTMLAHKLSKDLGAAIILEQFADNTFLEKFYENPDKVVFKLETSFLLNRFNQLKDNMLLSEGPFVADYYFGKSLVFAKINLKPQAFELFVDLYKVFAAQLREPDLIIYLNNTVSNLQKNIKQRGRAYEMDIEDTYLGKLSEGYGSFFSSLKHIPILHTDLTDKDFSNAGYRDFSTHTFYSSIWKLLQKDWPPGMSYVSV